MQYCLEYGFSEGGRSTWVLPDAYLKTNDSVHFEKTRIHIKMVKENNNTGEAIIIFFKEPMHCTGGDNYFLALYGSDGKIKDEAWVGHDMPIKLSLNDSLKIGVIFKKGHNSVDIEKLVSKIGKYSIVYLFE